MMIGYWSEVLCSSDLWFFFKQKTAYEMRISDWRSDVCSSDLGSANDWAAKVGYDQLPFWEKMLKHVAYDEFWQQQGLDKLVAANPSNVPTLWEQGLWDQEDMYGAITSWERSEERSGGNECDSTCRSWWSP